MNFSWKENSFYLQLQTIIIKTIVWHLGGFNSWHVTPSHSNHMVAMISTATQTHLFQPQWTKISRCNKACNSCSWGLLLKGPCLLFLVFCPAFTAAVSDVIKCKSNPSEQKVPASDCSVLFMSTGCCPSAGFQKVPNQMNVGLCPGLKETGAFLKQQMSWGVAGVLKMRTIEAAEMCYLTHFLSLMSKRSSEISSPVLATSTSS